MNQANDQELMDQLWEAGVRPSAKNARITLDDECLCEWPDGEVKKVTPTQIKDDKAHVIWYEQHHQDFGCVVGLEAWVPISWLRVKMSQFGSVPKKDTNMLAEDSRNMAVFDTVPPESHADSSFVSTVL